MSDRLACYSLATRSNPRGRAPRTLVMYADCTVAIMCLFRACVPTTPSPLSAPLLPPFPLLSAPLACFSLRAYGSYVTPPRKAYYHAAIITTDYGIIADYLSIEGETRLAISRILEGIYVGSRKVRSMPEVLWLSCGQSFGFFRFPNRPFTCGVCFDVTTVFLNVYWNGIRSGCFEIKVGTVRLMTDC